MSRIDWSDVINDDTNTNTKENNKTVDELLNEIRLTALSKAKKYGFVEQEKRLEELLKKGE